MSQFFKIHLMDFDQIFYPGVGASGGEGRTDQTGRDGRTGGGLGGAKPPPQIKEKVVKSIKHVFIDLNFDQFEPRVINLFKQTKRISSLLGELWDSERETYLKPIRGNIYDIRYAIHKVLHPPAKPKEQKVHE